MFWEILENATNLAAAVGIGGGIVWGMRLRRNARRIQFSGNAGKLTIVNFSAHPIGASENDWANDAKEHHLPIEVDMRSTEATQRSIFAAVEALPDELLGRLFAADPNMVIIPPAIAGGLLTLDAVLHGVIGEFPTVSWSVRTDSGFVFVKPVVRQTMRLDARRRLRRTLKM